MTFTDWAIDLALIGLVVLQLRGRRLTTRMLVLPLVLVGRAGAHHLHALPTAGNDLLLIVPATLVVLALGVGAGVLTGPTDHPTARSSSGPRSPPPFCGCWAWASGSPSSCTRPTAAASR